MIVTLSEASMIVTLPGSSMIVALPGASIVVTCPCASLWLILHGPLYDCDTFWGLSMVVTLPVVSVIVSLITTVTKPFTCDQTIHTWPNSTPVTLPFTHPVKTIHTKQSQPMPHKISFINEWINMNNCNGFNVICCILVVIYNYL